MKDPAVSFDQGTAYDLFLSLYVLHHPDEFNLRGAWAKGVRARLPEPARELVAELFLIPNTMARWVYALPEPKTAQVALETLRATPPEARVEALLTPDLWDDEARDALAAVRARGAVGPEIEVLLPRGKGKGGRALRRFVDAMLGWWLEPAAFGAAILEALEVYHEVFFAEEEARIAPVLEAALRDGRRLAERLPVDELLEVLSQGVRWTLPPETEQLVLVPVYWTTPILMFEGFRNPQQILLYGARPPEMGLVPGETVPDLMLLALKALAEPTRLRILRFLAEAPHSPSGLARRLRLRPPTVIHHLDTLRLARLVVVIVDDAGNRRYALRPEALAATWQALEHFLEQE